MTEAESVAGAIVAQDILYMYHLILMLGLEVELPMLLEMDNKGTVDLANNWSVGGRTQHMDVRNYLLYDLKDKGLLVIKHVYGEDNDAYISTKKLQVPSLRSTFQTLSSLTNTWMGMLIHLSLEIGRVSL